MQGLVSSGLATVASEAAVGGTPVPHTVLELRQYKIVPGRRDEMIALFERHFVESQEATGMRLVGQFRDLDDPRRFTWIRSFPDMAARETALNAFYFGAAWQAHRDEANPMLEDNDNVLLLRSAAPAQAFAAPTSARSETPTKAGLVVATIYYLWKDPAEGFSTFFAQRMAAELAAVGLPVLGAYVAEPAENTFPRLPVRQHEKVFVWFTRVADPPAYDAALGRLERRQGWRDGVAIALADAQERRSQILRLAPTPRSMLR